jgi:metallo-beta-lactamase family protein
MASIKFLGAAGTVTGSRFLVTSNSGQRILIDCGLFQGLKNLRLKNWSSFPVDPREINAVILSHAHVDHSGYLPKLVKEGFDGYIYSTSATKAQAEILLYDSAHLKQEEADYANKKKFSKHEPAIPLYTDEDVRQTMLKFRTHKYKEIFHVGDFTIKFSNAGHILGACSVLVEVDHKKILFSGDIGRVDDQILFDPAPAPDADILVLESTYGNRLHPKTNPIEAFKDLIRKAIEDKSVILIPSFAVGRAQSILYCINQVFEQYPDLRLPAYLNSPMAKSVTALYEHFVSELKLSSLECNKVCHTAKIIQSVEESIELNKQSGPMIIISASGMLAGGRVLHHLKNFGKDPNNIIVFAGFQAEGTRGATLLRGERLIKIHGYYHEIQAQIMNFDFFSAHADQEELINWVKTMQTPPKQVYLVHGEPLAADTLRLKLQENLGLNVYVPLDQEERQI